MKTTSKNANKLLTQYTNELAALRLKEDKISSFIAATIEDENKVRPNYDFNEYYQKELELEDKIVKIKHAINVFNTSTIVSSFNKTVDEMLVYIPQLTSRLERLNKMANQTEKERYVSSDGYGRSTSKNFIEYKYANYNISEANSLYLKTQEELLNAQIELDKTNLLEAIEI